MVFSSFVFISVFLPALLAAYYLAPKSCRNNILLLFSLIFYGWGDFDYLYVIGLIVLVNYLGAILVESIACNKTTLRKILVAVAISGNIGVLSFFKYFDFIGINAAQLFGFEYQLRHIILPLGISFYTFQGVSYLIDVYRGQVRAEKDILTLALFIMLFPQLVAGPILKYHDVCAELQHRTETFSLFSYGVRRFIMGLAKKVIVANSMGYVADQIFALPIHGFDCATAWVGALSYSMQLYFDFSGYSDMAIGLGAMFGFRFSENFNHPYLAKSITEFWRRWHISLSTWFKEYLYIPLGGNRVSLGRNFFNLFVVFAVTGIWHGAAWTFVVWGVFHGMLIIMEKATGFAREESSIVVNVLHRLYLLFMVVVAWVIFRSDSLLGACGYIGTMFGLVNSSTIHVANHYISNWSIMIFVIAGFVSMGVYNLVEIIIKRYDWASDLFDVWLGFLFVVSLAMLAGATYNPFIYFRF